jgi:hypothetical protein
MGAYAMVSLIHVLIEHEGASLKSFDEGSTTERMFEGTLETVDVAYTALEARQT